MPTHAVQAVCVTLEYPEVLSVPSDGRSKGDVWPAVSRLCPGDGICLFRTSQCICIQVLTTTPTLRYLRHTHIPSSQATILLAHKSSMMFADNHGLAHAATLTLAGSTTDSRASGLQPGSSCCAHEQAHTHRTEPLAQEKSSVRRQTDCSNQVFSPCLFLLKPLC